MTNKTHPTHTPGPWTLGFPNEYAKEIATVCTYSVIALNARGRMEDGTPGPDVHLHEALANARLIAQAPTLLKALRDAVDVLQYVEGYTDQEQSGAVSPDGENLEEVIARFCALLAAIEGKEEHHEP